MKGLMIALAALALLAVAAPGSGASSGPDAGIAKKCGLYKVGKGQYLTQITKRKGVSCTKAKRTHRKALEKFGGDHALLCGEKKRYRGWIVKPRGAPALAARYKKGKRRFNVSSQGACDEPA